MNIRKRNIENRLTFVISSLRSGGAERVLSILTRAFVERDYEVTVVSLAGDPPFYQFDDRVEVILLNCNGASRGKFRAIWQNLTRIRALRKAIKTSCPNIVISFLDRVNVMTLLALFGVRIPVIVSEHTVPGVRHIGRAWEYLRALCYPFAKAVVVLSDDSAKFFHRSSNVEIIPNPVVAPTARPEPSPYSFKYIVSVGRMSEEKRFELMIRSFAEAYSASLPDSSSLHLVLVGDGPLRVQLMQLVEEVGLKDRVHFPGRVSDPERYVAGAEFYLCASRVEGFGLAVCEALALGVPALATDSPGALRDIIRSGENGWLVPDEQLVHAMRDALSDERRPQMALNAPLIVERYSLPKIVGIWEELFSRVKF